MVSDLRGEGIALFIARHVTTSELSSGETTKDALMLLKLGSPKGFPPFSRLTVGSGFPSFATQEIVTSVPAMISDASDPFTVIDRCGYLGGAANLSF